MAITTWLTDFEKKIYNEVKDKEVNELFQEARKINSRMLLHEQEELIQRGWFQKPISEKFYTLYLDMGYEAQVYNFPPIKGTWSINELASKGQIMTYLLGFLNGHKYANS